jgi:hypothetical protein
MRFSYGCLGLPAIAMSFLLSACGGGDDDSPPPPPPNQIPISNAGADQSVFKAVTVTLDGTASSDPDGNPLSYRWTQTSGTAVSLSSGTASRPTFVAPGTSGTFVFLLVVNDGRADSVADTVQVTVTNRAPSANAGADAIVEAATLFTLDGLGSTDADQDALTYTWTQLAGPPVTLTTVGNGRARFSAPPLATRLEFGLVANDGEAASAQDVVVIQVSAAFPNLPPVGYVYGDFSMPKRGTASLSGYGYDPDGSPITFRWTQVSGPTVTLEDAGGPYPTFTAPAEPAVLTFEFVVSDGSLLSTPRRVVVTVENMAPDVYINAFTPDHPRTLDDLVIDADTYDADSDPVTVTYNWSRNGLAIPAVTGATYPASLTTRGDVIAVSVVVNDGTVSTSVDASTTIEDTPPTLSANAPTSVNYGDTVSFQVTASGDPDGDPAADFVVRLGPAGFATTSGGAVSWQARLPMFDDHVDIAWNVGLEGAPSAGIGGTIRVNHASRQVPLMRSGDTSPQNRELMLVTDLDADGIDDILVSDGRTLATQAKSGAIYQQNWAYPFSLTGPQVGITALAAGNVNGDANQEIFVVAENRFRQLDGVTRKVAHEYVATGVTQCYSLRLADLDGDSSPELVCLAGENLYGSSGASMIIILDAATLAPENVINQTGLGTSMDVGNVDADAALEIVTANGYVFDGATRMNEWAYGPQFGSIVETGDIDGNGVDEIIALNYSGASVFSAVTRTLRTTFTSNYCCGITELRVVEIGGDSRREVLLGDSQWGNITAFRYNTTTQVLDQVFTATAINWGTVSIGAGNFDADANVEIIWGTSSSLVVAQHDTPTSIAVEWNSATAGSFDGPFHGGLLARTAVGTQRVMFVSPRTSGSYAGAKLFALDPATGNTAHSSEIGSNWANATGIDVGDTDSDNIDEVFLSSADLYTPFYATYDFASDAREWTSPTGYSQSSAIAHADLTGDGNADFAAMGTDSRVSIFNVAQQNIVWQSPQLQGYGSDIALADLDHDGQIDVIALTDSTLYVFGRASASVAFSQRASVAIPNSSKVLAADTDGDGEIEIHVISAAGYYNNTSELRAFDRNLTLLHMNPLTVRAGNLVLEPSANARKNLLISVSEGSYSYYTPGPSEIWAIDAATGTGVWRSPAFPGEFSRESLHTFDVDLDGQYELGFGTAIGAFVTR